MNNSINIIESREYKAAKELERVLVPQDAGAELYEADYRVYQVYGR